MVMIVVFFCMYVFIQNFYEWLSSFEFKGQDCFFRLFILFTFLNTNEENIKLIIDNEKKHTNSIENNSDYNSYINVNNFI